MAGSTYIDSGSGVEDDKSWPAPISPEDLDGQGIKLPVWFIREVTSQMYTNETVGRILRCVLMKTDKWLDSRISMVVERLSHDVWTSVRNRKYKRLQRARERGENTESIEKTIKGYRKPKYMESDSQKSTVKRKPRKKAGSDSQVDSQIDSQTVSPSPKETKESNIKKEEKNTPLVSNYWSEHPITPEIAPDVEEFDLLQGDLFGGPTPLTKSGKLRPGAATPEVAKYAWLPGLFEKFWAAYPRRVGKLQAQKAFSKYACDTKITGGDYAYWMKTVLEAIEKQKRSKQWQKDNGKYIPHPSTWLNQGRWMDEVKEDGSLECAAEGLAPENDADISARLGG